MKVYEYHSRSHRNGRKPCKMTVTVLYLAILITIIFPSLMGLPVSSNIFNASITTTCPSNTTSYEDARLRKNCTGNTRYMCAPYKDLSYLLEYCTSTSRSLFLEDHCLTLQDSGFFDVFPCRTTFVNGCPNISFFDENLYEFPSCISINTDQRCFLADKNCSTPERNDTSGESTPRTTNTTESDTSITLPVTLTVLLILVLVFVCIISFVIWKRRKGTSSETKDSVPLLEGTTSETKDAVPALEGITSETKDSGPALEDATELFESIRGKRVPAYCVKGYIVGFSEQKDDLLECLRENVEYVSFKSEDLKPIFSPLHAGSSLKRTEVKLNFQTNNQGSLQGSEATVPMLNGSDVDEGNEDKKLVLKVLKDFIEEPQQANKVLSLRDFSGKIESFALQQTSLCEDVLYIFAIDMAHKLDDPSNDRSRTVKDYYAHWMDVMLTYRKREEDCLFMFVATNTDSLSSDAIKDYFADLWEMYERKSGNTIEERKGRQCVLQKNDPNDQKSNDRLRHCIENSLKKNPKWGIEHPLNWGVIERFILEKRKTCPMMKTNDLFKLFKSYCFEDKSECIKMLEYFNDIGIVVFVNEERFRDKVILDVGWFWNAVEKMTDSHYFQSKHGHDAKHFLETGLLTLREFNKIWNEKETVSKECGSCLQSLEMLANFTETSEMDEAIYVPCMNKKPMYDISTRYRQSSILCFQFDFLPACLFHRIVVFCIEKMDWDVRTDECGKNLYDTAAVFKCQHHNILIGCNRDVVEARIFTIDTMTIDFKLASYIKKRLEDFLRTICENIYPTNEFKVGYRCNVLAKFCNPNDPFIVKEEHLNSRNDQECPNCSMKNPHSIQADRILRHWNEDSVRSLPKESLKEEDDGELTGEDNSIAEEIRRACTKGNFTQFEYERNTNQVKNLFSRGFLHKHDKHGNTILHLAAEGGSCDIFASLVKIDETTNVLEKTDIGETVLHIACKNAKSKMCVHLLSHYPALLRMETNRSWNASHFAAWSGDVKIMQHLEEKGLDLTLKTSNGYSILHIAAKYNQYEMCEYILKNHSELLISKTEDGLNAAHYAAKQCNSELLQLFQNDINVLEQTNRGKTILHIACEIGDTIFFSYVVGISTPILKDVDDEDWNALHYAAKSGNVDIAKGLVRKGVQAAKASRGKTILHIACNYNRYQMCLYITERFPHLINDCNYRGWNAAHYVVVVPKENDDSVKILELLFSLGVDLQKVSESGNTILTLAYCYKNTRIVKYLLHKCPPLLNISTKKSLSDIVAESNDKETQLAIEESKRSPTSL